MKLDLKSNTASLRERLQTETDPVLRRNIALVIRHIEGEIANNVDLTMTTMVPEPAIRSFFASLVGRFEPKPAAPAAAGSRGRGFESYAAVEGGAAVKAMYDEVCRLRLVWTHFQVDRLVVDRTAIVQDGIFYCPTLGSSLRELGREVDDDAAYYLGVGRFIVVFPFDRASGLLLGEDVYIDPTFFDGAENRKVDLAEFLPGYPAVVDLPPA